MGVGKCVMEVMKDIDSLHVQYLIAAVIVDRDKIPENKGGKGRECFIHFWFKEQNDLTLQSLCIKKSLCTMFNCCKNLDFTYTPLEWINDIINAISYYSVLRNATAHMHRKRCF